jgi:hypothetical protein
VITILYCLVSWYRIRDVALLYATFAIYHVAKLSSL